MASGAVACDTGSGAIPDCCNDAAIVLEARPPGKTSMGCGRWLQVCRQVACLRQGKSPKTFGRRLR
jgi:hypothetical protein